MKFSNKERIISVLFCLSLSTLRLCTEAMAITKTPEFPEDMPFKNKRLLSESDLVNNYEMFSRNAVTRDTIVSNPLTDREKYVSINNGRNFNIPIDEDVMSRPIGTYQYIDSSGDLHIVNYINDSNGLKILNDYKPYANQPKDRQMKNIQSIDPKNKYSDNNNEFPERKYDVMDESNKDINYEEFEFTFIPQEINKSENKNNETNDLNVSQSLKSIDKSSAEEKSFVSNEANIQRLTQIMDSIPLTQPFSAQPNRLKPPLIQRPDHSHNYWREHQSMPFDIPAQEWAQYSGSNQQFSNFFDWNYN